MDYKKASYSAADSLPVKIIQSYDIAESIEKNGCLLPLHVQFMPTNHCNLNCRFCSCRDDDRTTEMSFIEVCELSSILSELGTKAMTITGGGEPLMHSQINDIIDIFYNSGIEIGLVTNGLRLSRLVNPDRITWCRISHSDERKFTKEYRDYLKHYVLNGNEVDWSFSYVLGRYPDYDNLEEVIRFANENNFTHVRIVSDIMQPSNIPSATVEAYLRKNVDCSNVIFQARNKPTRGGDCYICYLKPVISADGRVYTCCGAQYAINSKDKRRMADELCLGHFRELPEIIDMSSLPFDGSICDVCYYSQYNNLLGMMLTDLDHENFV